MVNPQTVRAIGWIVLLSAVWMLGAHTLGWDNANWFQAGAFGFVVYMGVKYAT